MLPAQSPESRTVARLQCVIHLAVLSLRLHDLFRQTDLDPDIRLHLVSQQIDRRGADGQRKEAARETPSLRLAIYRSGSGSELRSVPCATAKQPRDPSRFLFTSLRNAVHGCGWDRRPIA